MRNVTCLALFVALGLSFWMATDAEAARRKRLPWGYKRYDRPAIPTVKNPSWIRNPIDAFVLAGLEGGGLAPSPEASRRELIRRVTYDLTGLPPTPKEIEAFLADESEDAYEKLVDRLLASPRYGERWAMYWLDLVRYAESDGFRADGFRPTAWRYRDYVIRSFNDDKPFDRFLREQIAGDELYPNSSEAIIATAFNRHFPDEHNARNVDNRRQEILNDMTDVTGQVFLGLTMGCARCHDHKYDPLTQKDYYRLQAFFAAFSYRDDLPIAKADQRREYERKLKTWQGKTATIRAEIAKFEGPYRTRLERANKNKFIKEFQVAYDTPYEKRTPYQKQIADMVAKQVNVPETRLTKALKKADKAKWDKLQAELKKFDKYKPRSFAKSMGITDIGRVAPSMYILQGGSHKRPGQEVSPGFIEAIDKTEPTIVAPKHIDTTGRRAALAKWLSDPNNNHMTPRVTVNRLWQHHFGRGIVATPSDFGKQGDYPTHPELLNWLAKEFVAKGWSLKKMHRLMVTSNTYRQSSRSNAEVHKVDPQNSYFWRMNRRRLEGEALRDAMLMVAGKLNLKMGGPSIKPMLPKGVSGWRATKSEKERDRRSVYVVLMRNLRYPLFKLFDAPDSNESCARRHVSTNSPQALLMLNGQFSLDTAKAFASRVLRETKGESDAVVKRVYELALGRLPDAEELDLMAGFLDKQTSLVRERLEQKQQLAMPTRMSKDVEPAFAAAVVELCHVAFNLNEFLYVD